MTDTKTVEAEIIEDIIPASTFEITSTLGGDIEANFKAFAAYINQELEQYQGNYTIKDDADLKVAKAHRAKLNSWKREIEEKRKFVKQKVTEPYTRFEAGVKKLIAPISNMSLRIDAEVKQYEERQKQIKKNALQKYYEEYAPDLAEQVPFTKFIELDMPRDKHNADKWLNKTYSEMTARQDIENLVEEIAQDELLIDKHYEDDNVRVEVKAYYFHTLNLAGAQRHAADLIEKKKSVADMEARRAERQKTSEIAEEAKLQQDTQTKDKPVPWVILVKSATVEQAQEIGRVLGSLGVTGTFKQGTLEDVYRRETYVRN